MRPLSHAADLANVPHETQMMMDEVLQSGGSVNENVPSASPSAVMTNADGSPLFTDPVVRFVTDPATTPEIRQRFLDEQERMSFGRSLSSEGDLGGSGRSYMSENIPGAVATVGAAGALLAGKEAMASEQDPAVEKFKKFAALPKEDALDRLSKLTPEKMNAFKEAFNTWRMRDPQAFETAKASRPGSQPIEQGPLASFQPPPVEQPPVQPVSSSPLSSPAPVAPPVPIGGQSSAEGMAVDYLKKNIIDPVLEAGQKYVTRPGFEYAMENPKTAAAAAALRVPFVIPIMGALTKGPIDKTVSPSAKGMGAGEILARQAMKPFVGAGAMPGGVNFANPADADKPEAAEMVQTLEGVPVLGSYAPAMMFIADQAGQLPFWVLGNGTAQAVEKSVVAAGGALASAKLLPTIVRSAMGAGAEGAIGGGAQEALTVGGDPIKGAGFGAAFGGVLGGAAPVVGAAVRGMKTKVLAMWGAEAKGTVDDAVRTFVAEPDAVPPPPDADLTPAPLLENAPIPVKQEAPAAPMPKNVEPMHIKVESVLDPARRDKPMRVTVTEIHVSGGEMKKVQHTTDMSWLESQKFAEKHPNAVVDMDPVDSVLGAQFERMPKQQVDMPADVPEALVVKTGEDGVEKLVKQPMEAVDIRAPNERRAGDVVRMGDVTGIIEGPTLKHDKIRVRVNGKIELWPSSEVVRVADNARMAQTELAKAVPVPEPVPTDKTPIAAPKPLTADKTVPGKRRPAGLEPVELLPSSAAQTQAKVAKGQRFGPVVGGERKLELKHVIDAAKVWQVVTPKRLITSKIAQDMPEALSIINLLESTGVVYRAKPGRGATYLYNAEHPRRLYETAEEHFGGDTVIKSRIDDIKAMIAQKAEKATPADALPPHVQPPPTKQEKALVVEEMLKKDNTGYLVTYRTDEMRAQGLPPRNGVIKGTDVNGNLVVVDARSTVDVQRDAAGAVINRTRFNAEVRVKLGKEANMLLPATLPQATLKDVLKTDIPGVTTPLDIEQFLKMPTDFRKIQQNVREMMRREAALRNQVIPSKIKTLWRRTFGGGHDYVPVPVRAVAQRLAGADTGRDMATTSYRNITGEGLRPFSKEATDLRQVVEGAVSKMPSGMKAWAAANPKVTERVVAQVQTMIDYIQDLQGRLAEVGVTAVQIKNLNADELATMYLKAGYETFLMGPEKRLAHIERQLAAGTSPQLDAAVEFFSRKGKTPAEVRADIAAVLREPDVGIALEKRGYLPKGVGGTLAERTVWDTPALKAVKELLGPIEDPLMRLTMSLQAAEAAYATAKAGDLLVNTPYFSRVPREDLTYRVPNDARYGRAQGGYTTPELAPFLDPTLMAKEAAEYAELYVKIIRGWKMTNTALGSSTVFLNNIMQNVPSLYASGGIAGFVDGSVVDVLSGWHHYSKNPTGIGPQNVIREAMQLGVAGNTLSHMETDFQNKSMQQELWAHIIQKTGGGGSFPQMMMAVQSFITQKGIRSVDAVLAVHDSIDQLAKTTTYVSVKKSYLKKGLSNDEAATMAASRVLRYFPDWRFVPPWVAKTRSLQGVLLAPFLSSVTNGMRITANIAADTMKSAAGMLPDNPYLAMRMAAGVGVGAAMYKGVQGIARSRGLTEADEIECEGWMTLEQKNRAPMRVWIGKQRNANGEMGCEFVDISTWNDITRALKGVNQGDPLTDQFAQFGLQVGVDLLSPQATLAAKSVIGMVDIPGKNVVQRMPTMENRAGSLGTAVVDTFTPGAVKQAQRLDSQMQDEQALTRSQITPTVAMLQMLGLNAGFVTQKTARGRIQEIQGPAQNLSKDVFKINSGYDQAWKQKTPEERKAATRESVDVMKNEIKRVKERRNAP